MGRSPSSDESGLKKGHGLPKKMKNSPNISKNMAMAAGEPSPTCWYVFFFSFYLRTIQ
ncbi:myb-related protein myb4 [Phtheirospermum japonicum]|uniref:Myb-related protein myb4 n=1 Tax=Phtheirospermum japonicum TaxID=374723 RepID=A0A830CJC4_9LAMI|nr:myb-related protein myb4 [Phtheirospermum japonicum]